MSGVRSTSRSRPALSRAFPICPARGSLCSAGEAADASPGLPHTDQASGFTPSQPPAVRVCWGEGCLGGSQQRGGRRVICGISDPPPSFHIITLLPFPTNHPPSQSYWGWNDPITGALTTTFPQPPNTPQRRGHNPSNFPKGSSSSGEPHFLRSPKSSALQNPMPFKKEPPKTEPRLVPPRLKNTQVGGCTEPRKSKGPSPLHEGCPLPNMKFNYPQISPAISSLKAQSRRGALGGHAPQ